MNGNNCYYMCEKVVRKFRARAYETRGFLFTFAGKESSLPIRGAERVIKK